ncbi:PREDICTED: glutathione S-transferase theta-1-like [Elephantulus edwardii]|uniref:glutathione S-transferase theta-1-like n=1 Tax=Elephantulus edwardii TaxID=28737 RepID=UPI0003F0A0D8|nr:PREDICTED: glutathione S-transferase theta-1-like [Elephantulus edwardii]
MYSLDQNPLGKVPALRDGDFRLAESVAILLYLSRKFQPAEHWYPPGLQARARVDEYLAWQHSAIQLPATNVYLCKSLLPYFSGQPVDSAKLETLLGRLEPSLEHLDQKVLTARPFLATDQISLADLVVFSELMRPTAVGCDVFRDRPHLSAWRARVEAALGPELVQEAHKLVLQPRDPQETRRDPQVAQELVKRLQERLR